MKLIGLILLFSSTNLFSATCDLRYEFYTGFNFIQKEVAQEIIEKVLAEKNIQIKHEGESENFLYVSDYPDGMGKEYQVLSDLLVSGVISRRSDAIAPIMTERDSAVSFEKAFQKSVRFLRKCN